jgi:hypothetical protein
MARANLEAYLRSRFGEVRRSNGKYGLELIVRCPICGKKKLSINAKTGLYQCWRGCMSGHVETLFSDIQLSKQEYGPKVVSRLPENVEPPGELIPLSHLGEDHNAMLYLLKRGLDPAILETHYGVRYCSEGQSFMGGLFNTTNTLIIPVWLDGKLIGWQSRLLYTPEELDDSECEALGYLVDPDGDWILPPKYFTSPGLDKGRILYNYDWARQSQIVVVCEGAVDAWKVGRSAVAAFGKGLTEQQKRLLQGYWSVVVLLLDPGSADKETAALSNMFAGIAVVIPVRLTGYEDAGAAPQMEIWKQIGQAAHTIGIDLLSYRFLL